MNMDASVKTDSPENRLIYAISGQALRDMIHAMVAINWRTDDVTMEWAMVKDCLRYLSEDSPFSDDDRWKSVIRMVNEKLPEDIAKDRHGRLTSYVTIQKRIEKAEQDIEDLKAKRNALNSQKGKVKSSQAEFPYVPASVTVDMVDPKAVESITHRIVMRKKDLDYQRMKAKDIEDFVAAQDEEMQKILTRIYITKEAKQGEVAHEMGIKTSALSNRITRAMVAYAREHLIPVDVKKYG